MGDFLSGPSGQRPAGMVVDPGRGNLMENALRAAQIGPYRVAHGARRVLNLEPDEPKEVAGIHAAGNHAAFIAMFLPSSQTGELPVTVSRDPGAAESSVPVLLKPLTGINQSFSCVLLPGDALYVQSSIPAQIVVCQIAF